MEQERGNKMLRTLFIALLLCVTAIPAMADDNWFADLLDDSPYHRAKADSLLGELVISEGESGVLLGWLAVGDDGMDGRASVYDVRMHSALIDTSNWENAIQLTGEPTPAMPDSVEMYAVVIPSNTMRYFALKVGDDMPLWSGISNVAEVYKDTIAPATVTTLRAYIEIQINITVTTE